MYSMDVATKKICLASEQLPKSFLYFPLDDLRDVITKKNCILGQFGAGEGGETPVQIFWHIVPVCLWQLVELSPSLNSGTMNNIIMGK